MLKKMACIALSLIFVFAPNLILSKPALADGDVTPPVLQSSNPADGATGLDFTNQNIVLTFDEPILAKNDAGQFTAINGTSRSDIRVWVNDSPDDVDFSIDGNEMTLKRNYYSGWGTASNGETVCVRIKAGGIEDIAGNITTSQISVIFTVQDTHSPSCLSWNPSDLTTNVFNNSSIVATYTETILEGPNWGDINAEQCDPDTAGIDIPVAAVIVGNAVKIVPASGTWGDGGKHKFLISIPVGAVKDGSGAPNKAGSGCRFTTKDGLAPSVTAMDPVQGSNNASKTAAIAISFSEDINVNYGAGVHPSGNFTGIAGDPISVTVDGQPQAIHFTSNPSYGVYDKMVITPTVGQWCEQNDGAIVQVHIDGGVITDGSNNENIHDITCNFNITDSYPPTVTALTPLDGSMGVTENTNVSITFHEPVVAGSAWDAITVTRAGTPVAINKSISGGSTLVLAPTAGSWDDQDGYLYTVTIPQNAIFDRSGNPNPLLTSSFRTQDSKAPAVLSTVPAAGAAGITAATAIQLTMSEEVQALIGGTALSSGGLPKSAAIRVAVDGTDVAVQFAVNGSLLTVTPSSGALAAQNNGQSMLLTIDGGTLQDMSGNPMPDVFTLAYTLLDGTPPTVVSATPVDGATGIAGTAAVTLTYSDSILQGAAFGSIAVASSAGQSIPVTALVFGNQLIITPASGNWDNEAGYTFTLSLPEGAVKDSNGQASPLFTMSFTTVDHQGPQVVQSSPGNGATAVPQKNTTITITFDENITINDLSAIKVYEEDYDCTDEFVKIETNGNVLTMQYGYEILQPSINYHIELGSGALKDAAGNTNASKITTSFETYDPYAPFAVDVTPADGATNVALASEITITFNDGIIAGAGYDDITVKDQSMASAAITKTVSANQLIIKAASGTWSNSKVYTVTIPANAIESTSAIEMDDAFHSTFHTPDFAAPVPLQYFPAVNATYVSIGTSVSILFDEPLVAAGNFNKVSATCNGAKITTVTKTISSTSLRFKCSKGWAYGKTYVITVPAGALKDSGGNTTSKAFTLKFTVMPAPVSLKITKVYPAKKVIAGKAMRVYYKVGAKSNLRLDILDVDGSVVRTITKANASGSGFVAWDGKTDVGDSMECGPCTFKLTATPVSSAKASPASKTATCTLVAKPYVEIEDYQETWDRYDDDFYLDYEVNTSASVTISFYKGSKLIKKFTGSCIVDFEGDEEEWSYEWNGYVSKGKLLPAGNYKVVITINNGCGTSTDHCYVTVY